MKKRGGFFMLTMWWFILFAVIGGLTIIFTPHRERISHDENRVLQNLPEFSFQSFLSGEYESLFENFLSDSIPGRKTLIGVSDKILDKLSINTKDDMYYLDTTAKEVAEYQGDQDSSDETEAQPDQELTGDEVETSDNQDDAHMVLEKRDGGKTVIFTYKHEDIKKAAENIEKYAELLPDDGHVYLTFVPFPGVARRFSGNLDQYSGWSNNVYDKLKQYTSDKVVCFDSLKILEPHMLDGEELFLYGNHQWNVHGSYYVYCEMIKAQGLTPTPYDEYEYKINRPTNGGNISKYDTYELLYPLAPSTNYRVSHIDKLEEIPFMSYGTATTSSYLYGNIHPWKKVVTGFHTGRKALVIGDCFDLSLTPFLLPYYDEVHKTDIRSIVFNRKLLGTTVADMMQRNDIDDVYLIFSDANSVDSYTISNDLVNNLF